VSFITIPYEAKIYLDGKEARDAHGVPYRTPCTVPGLPGRMHRVVFEREGLRNLDIGDQDLGATREVVGKWPEAARP